MRLIQYILFIGIFFCVLTAEAQVMPIQKSKNKVVVEGKTYLLHIVAPKQTLYSICKAYGVDMAEVMRINNKKSTAINVNDALRIPTILNASTKAPEYSGEYLFHTVKKGDTLFALYKKYGVSIADIIKNNPNTEEGLSIGEVIKIPKLKEQKKEEVLPKAHFDKKYYYYIVKKGDTRYGIAKKFGIKYRKMRRYNRFIKKRDIRPADEIRIPLKYVSKEYLEKIAVAEQQKKAKQEKSDMLSEENKQKTDNHSEQDNIMISEVSVVDIPEINKRDIHVALLLPLYLYANDTINKVVTIEDSIPITTERNPRVMYRKTKNFLRFYQGVLTAIDTLKQQGYNIKLKLFDTQNNPQVVRKTLSQMQSTPFDFILGPIYSETFSAAAQFAKIHQIPIISPLSVKNMGIENNPFAMQLNASVGAVSHNLADYVTSKKDKSNIVVLHSNDYKKAEEYSLVQAIQMQLFEQGKYWNTNHLSFNKLNYDIYGLNGLSRVLRDSCENIVVIPSNDQPLVEHYITELNILKKQFNIRVVGYPKWQRFNSLELDLFYDLNLTLISPYFIDYNIEAIENFASNFRDKFGCEPNDFSFRGYDAMLFFSKMAGKYGKSFLLGLNTLSVELLQSKYQFKKVGENGGYENRGFFLINYNKNYSIQCKRVK